MVLTFLFATTAQPDDVVASLLKPLLPFFILAVIVKILTLFIPKKRAKSQNKKRQEGQARLPKRNLIPCPDCQDLISPKAVVCPHCGAPIAAAYASGIQEKRKRAQKTEKAAKMLARAFLTGFWGMVVFVGAIAVGSGWNRVIWALIGLLLMILSVLSVLLRFKKGKIGELLVAARLRKGLPENEYAILNDVYLPIGNEGTTQIDHIVVSRFGVFVVETKNYTGWIFADASSKVWTQTIYHEKNAFQNPMRQNYRHVCAISENLGMSKDYIRGVVAFTGDCEFKTPMPEGVVYSRRLADYIKTFTTPVLKERETTEIVEALREWDATVSPEQRAAHVDNLRKRHGMSVDMCE